MKTQIKTLVIAALMLISASVWAQSTFKGKVVDAETGESVPGASVLQQGTTNGTATDIDGNFTLQLSGTGKLVVSFIGYSDKLVAFDAKGSHNLGTISLATDAQALDEVVVVGKGVIDIAKGRETPVALTNIRADVIQAKLGNKEFPEIMNTTPSVYATKKSGGFGDSRINVRGFDQRNTAVIINGQPVNDMENGWVYWSNWAGLSDIASGVQIQRGLGASKLAVPSVGGTINIVTKATDKQKGGFVRATLGNDGYMKTVAGYNTGTNEKGWATSVLLGRWEGDGYVDGLEGEGYTYFISAGYTPSEQHTFNLTLTGAAQWHNQRSLNLSIRDYQKFGGDDFRKFNGDLGYRNGDIYTLRKNFYNKPIATFNWDWNINEKLSLSTSIYGSWGRGGGTGPRGKNYGIYPYKMDLTTAMEKGKLPYRTANGLIDFDAIIANNKAGSKYSVDGPYKDMILGSHGYKDNGVNKNIAVRRASMNSHDWYGAISNLKYEFDNWTVGGGIDLRTYTGYHYRVLNDLLGLDGYYSTGNKNLASGLIITETVDAKPFKNTGLNGDKIDYYNIGKVKWAGFNGIVEYKSNDENLTAVMQAGLSNQSYKRIDYFDQPNNVESATHDMFGGYVKGGANYNINDQHNVFMNAGYISRQPNFDAISPNYRNKINKDAENEIITSVELGYGFKSPLVDVNLNLYHTKWDNQFKTRGVDLGGGVDGTANFEGINQLHQGLELEARIRPIDNLKVNAMMSVGNWRYTENFQSTIFDDNQNEIGSATLYMKDVKIGDAAQFTASINANYRFLEGFNVDATWRNASNLYADYNIAKDDIFLSANNKGALKLPSYNLFDLGLSYRFKFNNSSLTLRANMDNVFDEEYISESRTNIHTDNNTPSTYQGIDTRNLVWFGFGRTWNVTATFKF